jgi:hypothetical protein
VKDLIRRLPPLACASILMVSGCFGETPPEIARDLPVKNIEKEPAFAKRLQSRFPVGSSHARLSELLSGQGFKITQPQAGHWRANIEVRGRVCRFSYSVLWRSDDNGTVSDIDGRIPPPSCH